MLLDGYGLVYRGYFALPPLTTSKGELVNGVFGFASIVLRGLQDLQPDYLAVSFDLPGPDVPPRAVRRVQGDPDEDAGRPARPVPEGPRGRQGAPDPGLRDAGLRGRRRHRHDHQAARLARRPRDDDRHRRPRHAPARHAAGPADDDPLRRREHGHVRRREDRRAVRAAARPDGRLQGAQGRPDRQHPGRARRRREDRREADPRLRRPRRAARAARRGHARRSCGDKLREHVDQIQMGRELSRIVRDLPIADRPRGGPARRLRPRHRRPPVPRVRVPDADRAPAADGRRVAAAADRQPPGGGRERLRAGGPGRRPAGGLGRQPRPARRPESGELQLRLDFDVGERAARRRPATAAPRSTATATAAGDARSSRSATCPTALAAAIVDPGRIEVRGAGPDRRTSSRWLAAQPVVGASLVADDPAAAPRHAARARRRRPRRPRRRRRRRRGGGRAAPPRRAARACRSSATRSSRSSSPGSPTTSSARRRRSRSTPRSRRTSSTRRCAARRSPTSSPSTSTRSCRRRRSCRPRPGPGSRRCRRSPSASRSSAASPRSKLDRLFREIELPLIPVLARMEAVGVALDREALAVARPRVPARDRAARAGDLRRRRPRVQPRQPQAARAGPVLRAEPAEGQADEDRLLDRRVGARGAAAGAPDDRQAPRVAGLHEAPLDLRRGAADADRRADGRLHTTFHQAVAATGRLSSSDPNLQNIPIRTALGRRIRRAFVAGAPDLTLLAADYSQIELRILAHVSGDEHLKDAFARKADIHRETAARVLHKDAGGHHPRRAVDGQDGQLRAGLRDERLRARVAGEHPAPGGAGVHQPLLRGVLRDQLLHDGDQGAGEEPGLRRDAPRPEAPDPGAAGVATRRCAGPASGWRSTCRSRARPPTSRRSR